MNCKFCGAPISLSQMNQMKCSYCDQMNHQKSDNDTSFELEELYNYLFEAAAINKIEDLKKYASLIHQKSKGTFSSFYFEKYAEYRLKLKNELIKFLEEYQGELTQEDAPALDHLIQHSELKDKKNIIKFLKKWAPQLQKKYNDTFNQRSRAEDNYAKVPRDVFICFSSSNLIIANQIVKMLEAESISCWISERNLREQGTSNYWEDILSALDRSKIVVLVSSESEMNSPDVARELNYANDNNKKIVEFKIDLTPHNLTFKHLFSGNRWVDATEDINKGYLTLKTRVFNELKLIQKSEKTNPEKSPKTKPHEKPSKIATSHQKLSLSYYIALVTIMFMILVFGRFVYPILDIRHIIDFNLELILP